MTKKDKKIFSLSIQDLKDLGIIKTKKKRKNKHKNNKSNKKFQGELQMGGLKSDSTNMKGYSNAFNPSMNKNNDTEYQVNKIIESKGNPQIKNNEPNENQIKYNKLLLKQLENDIYNFVDDRIGYEKSNVKIEEINDSDDDDDDDSKSFIDPYDMYENRSDNNGAFGASPGSDNFTREGEPQPYFEPPTTQPPTTQPPPNYNDLQLPYYMEDGTIYGENPLNSRPKREIPQPPNSQIPYPPITPKKNKIIDITDLPTTQTKYEPEPIKEPIQEPIQEQKPKVKLTRKYVKNILDEVNNINEKGKKRTKEETLQIYKQLKGALSEDEDETHLKISHPAKLHNINLDLAIKLKDKYKNQKK